MNRGNGRSRLTAILLILTLSVPGIGSDKDMVSAKTDTSLDQYKELLSDSSINGTDYKNYIAQYDTTRRPDREYVIEAKDYVRVEGMTVQDYIDYEGMLPSVDSINTALPSNGQVFTMLLYQNGGEYYNQDATKAELDNDIAVRSFKQYCEFYTDYRLEKELAVDQRFRTGEAPIIIADYTLYNQLQVSAPDIKGLWGFTKVPGTVKEDGSVDHSVSSTGSAAIIMNQTKDKEASWDFLKWWISTETQIQYGREMEALMGAAARYPTANIQAFESLPWPSEDYEALKEQFVWMKGIPQVPGGYYAWRNVNNAFYKVVTATGTRKMQPREALTEFVRYINEEITFKRTEFGLPITEEGSLHGDRLPQREGLCNDALGFYPYRI